MSKTISPIKYLTFLYPFLFSLYPGLALVAHNLSEITFSDSLRSLIVSLFLASTLFFISKLLFDDWPRAALLATIALILFFSYGHTYNLLREATIFDILVFRHRVLGLLWLGLLLVGFWGVKQKWLLPDKLAPTLTFVAIAALAIPIWQIADFTRSSSELEEPNAVVQERKENLQPIGGNQNLPDIYYIILDAYPRDDILLEHFDFDNAPFLKWLSDKGFFVAQCSQSNYAQTLFSLASTLNMNYVDSFYVGSYKKINEFQVGKFKQGLHHFMKNSQVREFLEHQGYSIAAFETGFPWSELDDAEFYFTLGNTSFWQQATQGLNQFEVLFIRSTSLSFLSAVSPSVAGILLPDLDFPNKLHRERVLFALDTLEDIPLIQSRKFVFAHIVSPHRPFVFGPNGETLEWEPGFKVGYPNQISYINGRIQSIIEIIIEESENPPIIVLQSDHGPSQYVGEEGRMAILNAYYLPGAEDNLLYSSISPVNTFRIIFDQYFGQNFDLLEDESLYSNYKDPLNYTVVPQNLEQCQD